MEKISRSLHRLPFDTASGKVIIDTISPEIAGLLQLCAGQQAGCEAAVHAMNDIFQEEQTDAI